MRRGSAAPEEPRGGDKKTMRASDLAGDLPDVAFRRRYAFRRDRFETLSQREQTVLTLVAQGYSGAEIARRLGISTKTVDAYKHRVQQKLGLEHRTEYVQFAFRARLLG